MKAPLLEVDEAQLRRRRAIGADRWDEMWAGVLRMAPVPSREHQRILDEVVAFLLALFKRRKRGTLHSGINVFDESSPKDNYRIPDATFVATGRERLLTEDGVRGGGPDAVIEIASPGDESYDKLPFYAALGVREVVVVDRDTKRPEVYRLAGTSYVAVSSDRDGWVTVDTMRVRFRRVTDTNTLIIEDLDHPATRTDI